MKQENKEEMMNFLRVFFTENDGNKINRWNYAAFMQNFVPIIDKIMAADIQELINIQARITEGDNAELSS